MEEFPDIFASLSALDTEAFSDAPDENGISDTTSTLDALSGLNLAPSKRGGYRHGVQGRTATDRKRAQRARSKADALRHIAVLDFETDPADHRTNQKMFPFVAVLYSDQFTPVTIWEEDHARFIEAVLSAIENLPGKFTIYAHNGGSFDYMFLIHKLRGTCMFKGRAIMVAHVGNHEIRDSLHIIPTKLSTYKKDDFDYSKLSARERARYRDDITSYCLKDCEYLFQIVRKFIADFGLKLSIGQAAMSEIKRHYKIDRISEQLDGKLRGVGTDATDSTTYDRPNGHGYFYGGRVECLAGIGRFTGDYRLYDVNSMYPYVMASFKHPIGREYFFRSGSPSQYTAFVHLECDNFGAFVTKGPDGETTATVGHGEFYTTIWEYNTAKRLGLFANERIITCVDCDRFSDFSRFVVPTYANRQLTKKQLVDMPPGSERDHVTMQDMFYKFLLNNGYGKFSQNPRKFKEHYITGPDERPPEEEFPNCGLHPEVATDDYLIWSRRDPERRFNNVGTGASITGAARSVLMEAIHFAEDPIYCDTDSIICRNLPVWAVDLHNENLGAWKVEAHYSDIIICGKKQYAARVEGKSPDEKGGTVYKAKGVKGLVWKDYEDMLEGAIIASVNPFPTLTRNGSQFYMRRNVRATGTSPELSYRAMKQEVRRNVR